MIKRTLLLVFKDVQGKYKTLALKDPKDEIKGSEVRPVMNELIADGTFINGENKLTGIGAMRLAVVEDLPE